MTRYYDPPEPPLDDDEPVCEGCWESGGAIEPTGYHATCWHVYVVKETVTQFRQRLGYAQ